MAELTGYWQANLIQMMEALGAEAVQELLASFSCPGNADVEDFLHNKAIEFARQKIAAVHLVFTSYQGKPVLVGYYALANKVFIIRNTSRLSAKLRGRLKRFARFNNELRQYELSIPLIGQLGKNYANGYDKLIAGDDLLQFAFEKIRIMQMCVGGKFAYLECAEIPSLVRFYERNGFVALDVRKLDKAEIGLDGHEAYLQMIKYF